MNLNLAAFLLDKPGIKLCFAWFFGENEAFLLHFVKFKT